MAPIDEPGIRRLGSFIGLLLAVAEFIVRRAVRPCKLAYRVCTHTLMGGLARKGDLGSNVNKGYEISVCVDNNVNSMFHVLLHELAHNTVKEYAHSDEFWAQYNRLKTDAIERGFYTPIDPAIDFCGKKIKG